jgi:hypothetical protein
MTARDQDSAVGEEVCSGYVEATRERGRLLFADFGSATASFPLSAARDFEAEQAKPIVASANLGSLIWVNWPEAYLR